MTDTLGLFIKNYNKIRDETAEEILSARAKKDIGRISLPDGIT